MQLFVLEVVERKGPLTDDELLRELKNEKEELSFRELNRILMRLEINGLVRVSRQMKGKRRVEIAEERHIR